MHLEQIKNSIFVSNFIKMKRVVSLLVFALLLNGCDDGDLIQEDINFEDGATLSCSTNNIIYKLKDKESLLLEIPKSSFTFSTEPNLPGDTTVIEINKTNRLLYRFYNGTVSSDNICETIPPATPLVTDQWTAEAGKIKIFTTAVKTVDATNNSTKISGYSHNIVFKNVTFSKSNGTSIKKETFPFGNYVIAATPLPLSFDKTLEQCTNSKLIYNNTTSEALTLAIDSDLIVNTPTPLNQPRTALISATKNKLTYRLFADLVTNDYFCTTPVPTTPAISQEWIAVAGVANESGIIEVTTTTNGTGFKHTIVLKKVKLQKGKNDFLLGDNYLYGELLTTN
jgi:hypothetical protein